MAPNTKLHSFLALRYGLHASVKVSDRSFLRLITGISLGILRRFRPYETLIFVG